MSAVVDLSDRRVLAVVHALLPSVAALIRHRVGQALEHVPIDAVPDDEGARLLADLLSVTVLERAGVSP